MPDFIKTTGGKYHATKDFEIGDWDMDTAPDKLIAHGLDANTIRRISVVIRSDSATAFYFGNRHAGAWDMLDLVVGYFTTTNIVLGRRDGGQFDDPAFSDTPYNRGWVTVEYDYG